MSYFASGSRSTGRVIFSDHIPVREPIILALFPSFYFYQPYCERIFPDLWREQTHYDVQETGRYGEAERADRKDDPHPAPHKH
jgi:hypothetical protein